MALRLQRYTSNGSLAWPNAVDVTSRILDIEDFGLVTDNAGGVIAGFNVFPLGGSLDAVAKRVLANGAFPQSRLINVSTRAFVGTGDQRFQVTAERDGVHPFQGRSTVHEKLNRRPHHGLSGYQTRLGWRTFQLGEKIDMLAFGTHGFAAGCKQEEFRGRSD